MSKFNKEEEIIKISLQLRKHYVQSKLQVYPSNKIMLSVENGTTIQGNTFAEAFNSIPVTTITRTTAKAILAPSYQPSLIPYNRKMKNWHIILR